MQQNVSIKRTTTADKDFQSLIACLDHELWNELKEDQATYDQYNNVPDIDTAVLLYTDDLPVACGCFKEFYRNTIEIKRMFVQKAYRRKGFSKKIIDALERWAMEKGYQYAVLETSIHFAAARNLYQTNGYNIITNYPPYENLLESVCMKKTLKIL
jgi:GNAT superfamily N-acetyltransferase